jgi:hypothetical protein
MIPRLRIQTQQLVKLGNKCKQLPNTATDETRNQLQTIAIGSSLLVEQLIYDPKI